MPSKEADILIHMSAVITVLVMWCAYQSIACHCENEDVFSTSIDDSNMLASHIFTSVYILSASMFLIIMNTHSIMNIHRCAIGINYLLRIPTY